MEYRLRTMSWVLLLAVGAVSWQSILPTIAEPARLARNLFSPSYALFGVKPSDETTEKHETPMVSSFVNRFYKR